ncbi:MAG: hypothetical protein ABI648_12400 [Betaproteobacteria bacterium]
MATIAEQADGWRSAQRDARVVPQASAAEQAPAVAAAIRAGPAAENAG